LPNVSPDNILQLPKTTHNIWIFKVGTIDTYNIKLNNLIYTH
jgi:hypothetical protein